MTNTPITSSALPAVAKSAAGTPPGEAGDQGTPFADVLGQQLAQGESVARTVATGESDAKNLIIDAASQIATDTQAANDPALLAAGTPSADASAAVASLLAQLNPNLNKAALSGNPAGGTVHPDTAASSQITLATLPDATVTALPVSQATAPNTAPAQPLQTDPVAGAGIATASVPPQLPASDAGKPSAGISQAANNLQSALNVPLQNAQPGQTPESSAFGKMLESAVQANAAQPAANTGAAMTQVMSSLSTAVPQQAVQASVNTPLHDTRWPGDFSQKVTWLSTTQNQVAELSLNPPDLGPLNVVLKITDNQATALFTSPHGSVREAVENAMPKLREMLADSGITLGNATVSDQAPRERDTGSFTGSRPSHGDSRAEGDARTEDSLPAPVAGGRASRHNGMIDTFA